MNLKRIAMLLCGLALVGCGLVHDVELSQEAVDVFHKKYIAHAWTEMYEASGDELRRNLTRADFERALESIHAGLGAIEDSERTAFHVTDSGDEAVVVIEYETRFVNGMATEQFVWRIKGGNARLEGYTVTRSNGN